MLAVDVKSSIYIAFVIENNDKNPKFKVDHHGRTSKYKTIIAKDYVSNYSGKVWWKKLKILCRGHMLLVILTVKKKTRIAKNKLNRCRVEKIIKAKVDKLYIKWKGYDNRLIVG